MKLPNLPEVFTDVQKIQTSGLIGIATQAK